MAICSDPRWRQSMALKWKEMISKNRPSLCKAIDTAEFIDHLESLKVFNSRTCQTFRSTNGKYNQVSAILTALLKRPLEDFLKFCEALEKSEQKHIIEQFFTSNQETPAPPSSPPPLQPLASTHTDARPEVVEAPVDIDPLRGAWKDLIRNNYPTLVDNIDPDNGLMTQLISKKIISEWMQDTFMSKEGRSRRAASILEHLLLKRPYEDFLQFCDSLKATNQGHIVQKYLTLNRNRQLNQPDCQGPRPHMVDFQISVSKFFDDESLARLRELDWRAVFVEARSILVDGVETSDGFTNDLFALGVFNSMSYEACEEKETAYKKMEFVLDYMRRRPDEDFIKFCTALAKTNQRHIVNTLLEYKVEKRPLSISRQSSRVDENAGGDQARNRGVIAQPTEEEMPSTEARPGFGDVDNRMEVGEMPSAEENPCKQRVGDVENRMEFEETPVRETVICHPQDDGLQTEIVWPAGYATGPPQPLHESPDYVGQTNNVAGSYPILQNSVLPSQLHHGGPTLADIYDDDTGPADIIRVNVKSCNEEFYRAYHNDSYKISGRCRGLCVIINNEYVHGMNTRFGTQKDGQLLTDLFKGLHFTVKTFFNVSAMGIVEEIEKIARGNDLHGLQCFVLFVLSHGQALPDQSGRRNDSIFGSDGRTLSVNDILLPLTDARCPNLVGKPRLIFFQACRGEHSQTQTDSASSQTETDARGEQTLRDTPSPPVYRDFLIGYPTQREYVSFRNTELGSWYVNALVQVFMRKACNTSLSEMLNMVSGKISKWSTEGNSLPNSRMEQSSNYESHLTKSFYFFPGIVR